PDSIIYMDESGMDDNETYEYAWGKKGERVYDTKKEGKTKRFTMIAALSLNMLIAPFYFEGSCDRSIFELFLEQVRQPQRIYVRALNEQGELIAVFSKWFWQTGAILHNPSPDKILFPLWPQPFMSGVAEFPVSWVERGEQHVTFDVVIVPIPDEKLTLVLEPILADGAKEKEDHLPSLEEVDVLGPLHNWIRMKWNPPISEALPVDGYLPANREIVNALLHVQAGKIMRVQFLNASPNPLVSRSLEELKADLLGYCVSCQDAEKVSFSPTLRTIRLQLTLVKDLHALRIGSRSPSPLF
ncbi:MAG: hypothetical protein E4H32_05505, partial [Nitrospirales bacterium]